MASATSPPSASAASVSTKDARAPQRFVVRLAHVKIEGADKIEMLTGRQPGPGE